MVSVLLPYIAKSHYDKYPKRLVDIFCKMPSDLIILTVDLLENIKAIQAEMDPEKVKKYDPIVAYLSNDDIKYVAMYGPYFISLAKNWRDLDEDFVKLKLTVITYE